MQGLNTNNKSKPMLVLYASDIMLSLLIHAGPEDLQTSTGVRDAWRVIRWDSSALGGNRCSLPQVGDQDFRLMPIFFFIFFLGGGAHKHPRPVWCFRLRNTIHLLLSVAVT